jgi:hypothetical protein
MPMLEGFQFMERMWDPVYSTAVDKRRGAQEVYPGSRPSVEDRYILLAI